MVAFCFSLSEREIPFSARGIASRRKAEEMVKQGAVTVNGRTAVLGDSADPDVDVILVEGKPLSAQQQFVYLMLNKPRGYVTTLSDEKGRKNAAQLVADCGVRVYPVGRLDMDSEGLLLFTNDGEFANRLMHPKHEVQKTYDVWVTGYSSGAEERLKMPIELDGYLIKAPLVKLLSTENDKARLRVTIHEGRNRQVRKMCESVGHKVLALKRTSIDGIELGNLPLGKWRHLNENEIKRLKG